MTTFAALALVAGCGNAGGGDDGGGGPAGDAGVDGAVVTGAQVFDADRLHELELTVAAADLATLDNDQTVRVPCTVRYDGVELARAGCRKKGASSLRPLADKPGFTIKLDSFVAGQRLDGLRKLTVDNAVQDPSLVTGHLAYELHRRAGLPAPRTAHATLRFNGEDKGLYVVEESTTADYLAAHFGDGSGNLYEGPWDFPRGAAAADLKDEVSEMRTRDDLVDLTRVVMNTPDAQLADALAPLLDVDRFITAFAVEMAAVLWDNYAIVAWNFYLYHVPGGRFVLLTHGVNWPLWRADYDPFDLAQDPWGTGDPPGYLCVRLRRIPALDARFRAELTRVARDVWDVDALLARVDRAHATLHARPLVGRAAADLAAHDAIVDDVRAFVRDRRAYLAGRLGF